MILNSYLVTVRDEAQQISKRLVPATSQAKVYAQMQREKCKVIAIEQRPSPFLEALKKGRLEMVTLPANANSPRFPTTSP